MSLDIKQLAEHVIHPTLADMAAAHETPQLASDAAGALVLGTGAVESDYRYIAQLGDGPACGFWQVEPATAKWLDHDVLQRGGYSRLRQYFFEIGGPPGNDRHQQMRWNLRLACAYCRLRYWAVPKGLPDVNDEPGLAAYWKTYYNTEQGKGSAGEWLEAYDRCMRKLA